MAATPENEEVLEPTEAAATRSVGAASTGAAALGALALGAFAVGAAVIGALAVGAIAIGRLSIAKSHIKSLEIDELTVRRLTLETTAETRAASVGYKAAVKELLTQFSQPNDRIEDTQAETARLREETRVILAEIEALMSTSTAKAGRTEKTSEQEFQI